MMTDEEIRALSEEAFLRLASTASAEEFTHMAGVRMAIFAVGDETPAAVPTSRGDGADDTSSVPLPTDPGADAGGTTPAGGEQVDGPRFEIPVGIIEGTNTSDARRIASGALTWRTPPLPLMGLRTTTYDHMDAVIVGRIDEVFRDGDTIGARGVMDTSPEGIEFARLIASGMIRGVSADIANVLSEIVVTAVDDDGFPEEIVEEYTQGEVAGFTICPFPAIAGAYIVLVQEDGAVPAPPQTLEAPTQEAAATALHVLVDGPGCDSCSEGRAVVASGGPLRPPRAWFEDPLLDGPTRLTIGEDGRIFGHLAVFGTCHIGLAGKCVEPFTSHAGYAYFRTGSVLTAEGETVATGPITMGVGHAALNLDANGARAHYDDTRYGVADVAMGHDEYGIWIAGSTRPSADEDDVRTLRASALSGDWRWIGNGMEVVAALAVNVPGFPVVRALAASGHPLAMVAAGGEPLARITEATSVGGEIAALRAQVAVLSKIAGIDLDEHKARLATRMARLSA